jgi:hypothetical protein
MSGAGDVSLVIEGCPPIGSNGKNLPFRMPFTFTIAT